MVTDMCLSRAQMKAFISFSVVVLVAVVVTGPVLANPPAGSATIDKIVFFQLTNSRITPAKVCSDAMFVRRVYLDVIGTLPTAVEARAFLTDKDPNKRSKLIDILLERDEYADYWALKWGDILRVKAEFPINLWPNGSAVYYRWIHDSLKNNMPYDQFARAMITSSGSNFRVAPVNFYRAVQSTDSESLARAIALTFMGSRAEKWDEKKMKAMTVFFSQVGYKKTQEWKEEIIFFDLIKAAKDGPQTTSFPDGRGVKLSPDKDPREVFADWLITPKNPWFAKNIVNRAWY
ncbi:MAG TPA: DUF1549 domain-containing protein, partial [Phycisphaerae bacterium]|nr:DUF1549 domain-containing protein [Phycisphaerae bacterium]